MRSRSGQTQRSGLRSTLPFTFNRPSRINSRAVVREAIPKRESTRSSVMAGFKAMTHRKAFGARLASGQSNAQQTNALRINSAMVNLLRSMQSAWKSDHGEKVYDRQ